MIQDAKPIVKKLLQHLIAVVCFLVVTFTYFSPLLDGKVLPQGDTQQYKGMSRELSQYYNTEGESSAWTGSMFSGMPAYTIGVWGGSPNFLDYVEAPLKALGSSSAGAVFAGMLMAYILFCVMGVGFVPALIGAVAYSLSSYNIIIIDAGHVTKAWAIAYMPLVVAGIVACFRQKYLAAGLLMALGLALQIKNNHLQITYYTAILCVFLYVGLLIDHVSKKNTVGLLKATGALLTGVVIAVLCNIGSIYSNYEMSNESIRGKSELTQPTPTEKQSSGLDKEYAFAWSYGKMETLSLLIPNIHGGASGGMLSPSSNLYKAIRTNAPQAQVDSSGIQAQTYWGDQPFTSGPVYLGAIVCFLFVLGMLVIRHPMKWVLLASTLFFIFLSWGHNFEVLNDWFFYHFPLYSKFRAVSTALVIPALTMLVVAIWGLKDFFAEDISNDKQKKSLYIAAGITAGLSFLLWIAPGIFGFSFSTASDSQWMTQVPDWYYSALIADRKDLLSSDALRSFVYILLAAAALYASITFLKPKGGVVGSKSAGLMSFSPLLGVLLLLVIFDLAGVDKRYLNNDKFQSKLSYDANRPFPMTEADKAILQDKHPSYRVLNLNNPFNETKTSYYHKSIGGYNAAKLKRYQELIDYRLQGEINSIIQSFDTQNIDSIIGSFEKNTALNMLNAKYVVFHPEQAPLQNPYAMGNAWFVNNYTLVDNADQEIAALNTLNAKTTAIVNKKFEDKLAGLTLAADSTATIQLTGYKPNVLTYKSSAQTEQLAVLSEIYYPHGWEAYIDGKPANHFCADWTLRAIRIPAGQHEIVLRFEPHAYNTARIVASASSGLLVLLVIGFIASVFYRKKE